MGRTNRKKSGLGKSSSLPSRSRTKNIEHLESYRDTGTPVQVDQDRLHEVLREFKVRAIEIKATFKKYEKKKKTDGMEEVKCLAKNLGIQLHELFQVLGIQDTRRHSVSSGRRRSIDDAQLQFQDKSNIPDLNACRRCRQLEERNRQITTRYRELEELNKKITSEKEEALTRLSQIAGSKLRDNNPAIADLSDPNRPMKLSEKVSELYDNEWTETAEELEKYDKNIQYISLLRDIFIESYILCMDTADKNLKALYQLITFTRRHQQSGHVPSIPKDVRQKCKEFRKSIAEFTISSFDVQNRLWHYVEGKQGETVATICSDYIGKCVKYSWYMCIQDPPIHMEYGHKEGDKFVPDLMRAYTKTGPYIEFLVWPALHLFKNGALLSKAIVQGSSNQEKDPPKPIITGHWGVQHEERQTAYQPFENVSVPQHVEKKGWEVPISRNRDNVDNREMQVAYSAHHQKSEPHVHKGNQMDHRNLESPVYQNNQYRQQTFNQAAYHGQGHQRLSQTFHPSSVRYQRNPQYGGQSRTTHMNQIPNQTFNYTNLGKTPQETNL